MHNLQYIIAINFENKKYPQILKIAPNDEILQQLVNLLIKYSDNSSIIVNIEDGHFKFWLYEELNHNQVRYVWGKIGGTASVKDIYESASEAESKRWSKKRKGYQALI